MDPLVLRTAARFQREEGLKVAARPKAPPPAPKLPPLESALFDAAVAARVQGHESMPEGNARVFAEDLAHNIRHLLNHTLSKWCDQKSEPDEGKPPAFSHSGNEKTWGERDDVHYEAEFPRHVTTIAKLRVGIDSILRHVEISGDLRRPDVEAALRDHAVEKAIEQTLAEVVRETHASVENSGLSDAAVAYAYDHMRTDWSWAGDRSEKPASIPFEVHVRLDTRSAKASLTLDGPMVVSLKAEFTIGGELLFPGHRHYRDYMAAGRAGAF